MQTCDTDPRYAVDRVIYTCPRCGIRGPADRFQLRNGETYWLAQPCRCFRLPHVANRIGLPPHAREVTP
jgi:hypothetical protein